MASFAVDVCRKVASCNCLLVRIYRVGVIDDRVTSLYTVQCSIVPYDARAVLTDLFQSGIHKNGTINNEGFNKLNGLSGGGKKSGEMKGEIKKNV